MPKSQPGLRVGYGLLNGYFDKMKQLLGAVRIELLSRWFVAKHPDRYMSQDV